MRCLLARGSNDEEKSKQTNEEPKGRGILRMGMAEARRLRAVPKGHSGEESTPSDEELISAIASGQDWAAEALYDKLHPTVERTLRRILHTSDADYDDLVQTTFERIVTTLATGRFAGACGLMTWASAIAGHVAVDALRSRIRSRKLFAREKDYSMSILGARDPVSDERRLEARSQLEALQDVLGRLKPDHANTLVLHDVLGHDLSEIAVMTGVSVAAAQSRLVRARKELLRRLGGRSGASS